MSFSEIQICNMALSHIGAKSRIESLTEHSVEAAVCNLHYDAVRQQLLQVHNWNFARNRRVLALIENTPTPRWAYRHEYPSDCIQVRYIEGLSPEEDSPLFDIEPTSDGHNLSVLSNERTPTLIYTRDLKSTDMFSPQSLIALSWGLAAAIASSVTGRKDVEQEAREQYRVNLGVAAGSNAGESLSEVSRDAEWIRNN